MVFDTELRYGIVRGSVFTRHGFRSQDLEGQLVSDALGPERWAFYEPLYRAALQGETRSVEIVSPDAKHWYAVKVGPLLAGNREIIGGVSIAVEITARNLAEEQYRSLLEFTPDAVVITDGEGRIVLVNAEAEVLFDYARDELIGQPIEMLVPGRLRERHATHRNGQPGRVHKRPMGANLPVELFGQRKDRSEFPAEISLGPIETDQGPFVSAVIHDITNRKLAERAAAHLAAVVDSSHDAIIGGDLEGIVISWNNGAEQLFGYSEAEMLGRSISVLVPPGHEDELPEMLRRVRLGERIDEYETVREHKDGTQVDVSQTVSPIRGSNGTAIGMSTITRDITERLRYQEQLRYLAEQDALTGALNRRRFEQEFSEQVRRAHRYGEQAAVLVIDIDEFKQINDTYGHHVGDLVLKKIVSAITQRLRDTDVIARIGGDEFAVLLPYVGETQATAVANDLRRVIRGSKLDLDDGRSLSFSASVGLEFINKETASEEAVLAAADQAMYADKARRPPS